MVTTSFINRLSHTIDQIEKRSQPARPFKAVTVRRRYDEDGNTAQERHFAAHPEDQDANVVIFHFYNDEGTADEG